MRSFTRTYEMDPAAGKTCLRGRTGRRAGAPGAIRPLQGEGIGTPTAFFTGEYGRLRTVVRSLDGGLWLTTSNRDQLGTPQPGDDKILRGKP